MIFMLNVHPSRAHDLITPDRLRITPSRAISPYIDGFGNKCVRILAPHPWPAAKPCRPFCAEAPPNCRGRDERFRPPPAQIRTCGIPAYGLYGSFFVKGASRHFCRALLLHSFVRPAPRAFFHPDRTLPSPSRAAAVKDGASSAPPKACP